MSRFRIEIQTNSEPFRGSNYAHEITRILYEIAHRVSAGRHVADVETVKDSHGNVVGTFAIEN